MPEITLEGINNFICKDISLKVNNSELLVILGPTGAGKTTLLNIIAGLIQYRGTVAFDRNPIDKIEARFRKVGYLFQNPALFPHLNVRSNIAFGLSVQGVSAKVSARRVDELMQLMNITHLACRYPKNMSGGEKQRVALARALAPFPRVLLLDEPFSSLDFRTSGYLRTELSRIRKQLGITTIYVTHNIFEAREMADRVGVLCDGKLEQTGLFDEVFLEPANEKVSDFLGTANVLYCRKYKILREGLIEADCGGIRIVAPHEGGEVNKIVIFPARVYVNREKPPGPGLNRYRGEVTKILPSRFLIRFRVTLGENNLLVELNPKEFYDMGLTTGSFVYITLKPKWIKIL